MRITVLLSDARHPVSGRPVLSPLEAQAIGLGLSLGGRMTGLHAGVSGAAIADAFGYGLSAIDVLEIAEDADPAPALVDRLSRDAPDLILAGRRGQGGLDTGLVPYALAEALKLPIVADVVMVRAGETRGTIVVDAALARGARRRVTVKGPCVVTVHPLAPSARPFVFAAARRGTLQRQPALSVAEEGSPFTERAYRARPKLMRKATPSAAGGTSVHVEPEPRQAAQLILDYLETNGLRRF